jgi:phosphosulfolactate synthase (CoM biosynthesis protein A)
VSNNTLGYTGEGIYFSPVENMTGVMTTEEAREKVKKGGLKREQKFITASEYNSLTHFIFEMVEQLNGEIQLRHHEMCKLLEAVTRNMRYYAENGHKTDDWIHVV